MNTTLPQIIVPDAILTEFYEEYKGNIGRLDRAIQLVEAGHVERSNFPGLWLVRSASVENGSYRVANGCCNCADTARVGAQNCKHAIGVRIFRAAERAEVDAEQGTLCTVCHTAPVVADGMCARCLHVWLIGERDAEQSDPTIDPDAMIGLELTGRARLALVPTAVLPNPIGTCTRRPMNARARELYCGLYPDDDNAA